jgi:hypothetical protein
MTALGRFVALRNAGLLAMAEPRAQGAASGELRARETHGQPGSAARTVPGADATGMLLDDPPHDREAEARPPLAAREEGLEVPR